MYILYIALFVCASSPICFGFERLSSAWSVFPLRRESYKNTYPYPRCYISMRAKKRDDDGGYDMPLKSISPTYSPKTPNQKTYVQYLGEPDTKIVLGVGAAGSGKTLFACYTAIQELRRGTISKIIMTRPVVPVEEEEIGFLPGSLIHKMDPWTRPIFDILLEFYTQKDIDAMLQGGVIEISPLAYMRGRTFKRAFIIADEMQNSSPNQMLMLTTRLGEGSKMVITGDLKQSDRGSHNGLSDLLQKIKAYNNYRALFSGMGNSSASATVVGSLVSIKYVELSTHDVQRSAIVSQIIDIYENHATGVSNNTATKVVKTPKRRTTVEVQRGVSTDSSNNDAALIPIQHIRKTSELGLSGDGDDRWE